LTTVKGYGANGIMIRPSAGPDWGEDNAPPVLKPSSIRRWHTYAALGKRVLPYLVSPEETISLPVSET